MKKGSPKRTLLGGVGMDPADLAAEPAPEAPKPSPFEHLRDSDMAQTQPPATGIEPERNLVGATIGSYVVERVLGEGGVGTVYLAEHPIIGSRVAIKVLQMRVGAQSELFSRFVDEARAANAIANPHIVRVSDFGRLEDGQPYAVMEWLQGEPLDEVLVRLERLDAVHACRLITQAADALAAAHDVGIIHRDVKPENIFVEHGRPELPEFVRILDFGIAKLETADAGRKTAQGGILGTPLYCAPEQIAGHEVTPAADIYALGAVLYELLSGKPPFEGNVVEILTKKSTTARVDVSCLQGLAPPALIDLIGSMLAADPSERPATMRDVAGVLDACAALENVPQPVARADVAPVEPEREPSPARVPHTDDEALDELIAPAKRRHVGWWVAAGMAVLVGATIAFVSSTPVSDSPTPTTAAETVTVEVPASSLSASAPPSASASGLAPEPLPPPPARPKQKRPAPRAPSPAVRPRAPAPRAPAARPPRAPKPAGSIINPFDSAPKRTP